MQIELAKETSIMSLASASLASGVQSESLASGVIPLSLSHTSHVLTFSRSHVLALSRNPNFKYLGSMLSTNTSLHYGCQ
jgi:hypothetical protein